MTLFAAPVAPVSSTLGTPAPVTAVSVTQEDQEGCPVAKGHTTAQTWSPLISKRTWCLSVSTGTVNVASSVSVPPTARTMRAVVLFEVISRR